MCTKNGKYFLKKTLKVENGALMMALTTKKRDIFVSTTHKIQKTNNTFWKRFTAFIFFNYK